MYSKSLRCSCRLRCCNYKLTNKYIHCNYYHLLYFNHNYHSISTQYKSFRSFVSGQDDKQHDDSYLELDQIEEEELQQEQSKSRKWKSQSKKSKIESESTSEPSMKPSKWDSIKSTINKPFTAIKSKISRKKKSSDDTDIKRTKKEKMVHRPGKKSLPSPDQGVMTFIPSHKAQILHILQEECNIFPDEVFPLFPDHKTEQILVDAQDWFNDDIQFIDATKQDDTAIEDDDKEQLLLKEDDIAKEDDQLLLTDEDKVSHDSLIISKVETATLTVSDIMKDKTRSTASKLREQRVSGIAIDDERSKERDLSFLNPYKYRGILSPSQVKELYQDKEEEEEEDWVIHEAGTHEIWQQSADDVYEIIQLLREMGLKSNQNSSVWPYTEFMSSVDKDTKEIMVHDGGGLNPLSDTFNDFYLLFARFPEILSMEIADIRRKIHVLEQFQIEDIRILLLKDARVLRRPSHHIRWLLEVFDDYFVDDFSQMIELSPHFLASTSKKEILKRLCFIHREILGPYREYHSKINSASWYRNMQMELKHLNKNSQFIISKGKTIEKSENISNEMVNGIYLDDKDKENLSDFIMKHPDFIGNANVNRMNEMLWLIKKLGIKHKKLNDLLYEYPQILTISPQSLHECVDRIKVNGIRDYRQYLIDNIHDVLTYSSPVDHIVANQKHETLCEM